MINIAGGILIVVSVLVLLVSLTIHKIDEGHVGVYYRGGALLKSTAGPGFHLMVPFLTSFKSVQVSIRNAIFFASGLKHHFKIKHEDYNANRRSDKYSLWYKVN